MNKEAVYAEIKDRIIMQRYRPEQVLNEKELMQAFAIGRTPLREVLFDLQRDGLVSILPRYGTFVTPLSISDLRSLIQLRPALEELVGEISAENISAENLQKFKALLDRSDELQSQCEPGELRDDLINELRNLEAKMHLILYESTNNVYLQSVCRQLQGNTERYWHFAKMNPQKISFQIKDMRKIYEALVTRDKTACKRLLRSHTLNYINSVLTSLSIK